MTTDAHLLKVSESIRDYINQRRFYLSSQDFFDDLDIQDIITTELTTLFYDELSKV